jgi:serine/threonine-protein kinase
MSEALPIVPIDRPLAPPSKRARRKQRFEILERIGEGATGTVSRALDRDLNRMVAVKVLHPELASDLRHLLQLKRELILASRVHHANVVGVHDLGEVEGRPAISMDWIDGESLTTLMFREHTLPPSQVCGLAAQICEALDAIHAAGLIHRDLKPGNLLLDRSGRIFVADFGLARSLDASDLRLTRAGDSCGTPRYMAPEQLAGLPADARTDIYSLGLVLLEMLTGTAALETLEPLRQRLLSSQGDRRGKWQEWRKLSALIPIIQRCLCADRNERYQTADDVLHDLRAAEIQPSPAPGLTGEDEKPAAVVLRRRKLLLVALAVGLLALASVGVYFGVNGMPGTMLSRKAPATVQQLYAAGVSRLRSAANESDLRLASAQLDAAIAKQHNYLPAHNARVEALVKLFETTSDPLWAGKARQALKLAVSSGLSKEQAILLQTRIDLHSGAVQTIIQNLSSNSALLGSSSQANILLGRALEASGRLDLALDYYQSATRISPEDWFGYNELGSGLLRQGKAKEAAAAFARVIALNPEDGIGYDNLGAAHSYEGAFAKAHSDFESALLHKPTAATFNNVGVAAYYAGEYATSIPFFEEAIRMRPNSIKFIVGLGDAQWSAGRREAAIDTYTHALALLDSESEAGLIRVEEACNRVRCLARLGDLPAAMAQLDALIKTHADDPVVLYTKAMFALQQGRKREARLMLDRALRYGYPRALAEADPDLQGL